MDAKLLDDIRNAIINNINGELAIDYITNVQPFLVADIEKAEEFLYSSMNEVEKFRVIFNIYQVKEYAESHRPHSGKSLDLFHIYNELFKGPSIPKYTFNKLYECVCGIKLSKDVFECDKKVLNVISRLKETEDVRSIISFIMNLANGAKNVAQAMPYSIDGLDDADANSIVEQYSDAIKHLDLKPSTIIDALAIATSDFDNNDVPLENQVIWPLFKSSTRKTKSEAIFIIEPNIWLVKKLLRNEVLSQKTIIVLNDEKVVEALNAKYSKVNIEIICADDFTEDKLAKFKNHETILFAHHIISNRQKEQYFRILKNSVNGAHSCYVMGTDNFIQSKQNRDNMLSDGFTPSKVWTLPDSIFDSTYPKRKLFVKYEYGYITPISTISVMQYSLLKNDKNFISNKTLEVTLNMGDYENGISFRKVFRDSFFEESRKSAGSRSRYTINFTKEIEIGYNISQCNTPGKVRVKAYINLPALKLSTERRSAINQDLIEKWLLSEYPYSQKRRKGALPVNEIASGELKNLFANKPITLKTFLYIFANEFNWEYQYYQYEYEKLFASDLSNLLIKSITRDLLVEYIDSRTADDSDDSPLRIVKFLREVFKVSLAYGYVKSNIANSIKDYDSATDRKISNIFEKQAPRFLDEMQISKLIKICKQELDDGNREYIAPLLKLTCGLQSNIVAALKWKDFSKIEGSKGYKLTIMRSLDASCGLCALSNSAQYRCLPVFKFVQEILLDEKQRQLECLNCNNDDIVEHSIIQGSDAIIDGTTKVMSTRSINKLCINLIKRLGVQKFYVEIPGPDSINQSVSLDFYGNDILRETFRHQLIKYSKLSSDDINHLLGLQCKSTLGRHYLDYENDMMQQMILKELNKTHLKGGE